MSLTAKVRPASGWRAAGGGSCGYGSSSSRSMKAPRSSFSADCHRLLPFLLLLSLRIRIPATLMPTAIQSLVLETWIFRSLRDLSISTDQRSFFGRRNDGRERLVRVFGGFFEGEKMMECEFGHMRVFLFYFIFMLRCVSVLARVHTGLL